jgi:hypothetical protein
MGEILSDRFGAAAAWANELHGEHVRKGSQIPYVSHLFAVASLVLEDGGNEDQAIAALLHDAVEDGKTELPEIKSRFGADVAAMVEACSDTLVNPKPPWRNRKQAYIDHLNDPRTSEGALRVSAADKVHNARCILADYRAIGDELWTRFNPDAQSGETQLWYYEHLIEAFEARRPNSQLTLDLRRTVNTLRDLVGFAGPHPAACPACAGGPVVPIVYGYPDESLLQESADNEVAMGGCCITSESPAWQCLSCSHQFGLLPGERLDS